jgi:hypothetical protein
VVGYLINGPERLQARRGKGSTESHLEIRMPGYENGSSPMQAGDPAGEVVLDKLGGKEQHVPCRRNWAWITAFSREPHLDRQPRRVGPLGGEFHRRRAAHPKRPSASSPSPTMSSPAPSSPTPAIIVTSPARCRAMSCICPPSTARMPFCTRQKSTRTAASPATFGRASAITRSWTASATRTRRCRMPTRSPPCAAASRHFDFAFPGSGRATP